MSQAMSVLVFFALLFGGAIAGQWPVPYERVTSRPTNNPYCQAGLISFCPTGRSQDAMIYVDDDDATIEIFALKKPVWSFKFGDLMAKFVSFVCKTMKFRCFVAIRKSCTMHWVFAIRRRVEIGRWNGSPMPFVTIRIRCRVFILGMS
jgi:hypothetical protein